MKQNGRKVVIVETVGLAMVRITGAVLRAQCSLLTASSVMAGEHGLSDLAVGLPTLVSRNDAERIMESRLSAFEKRALHKSAGILRNMIARISGTAATA